MLATQKWARDSVLLDKDLVVTKDGAVITCTIDEEQADSVTFTIPYMGNVVRVSMSRDEIAYAGKAAVLKPSGGSGSADDLIIKKTGEIMVCDITSNYNNLIGFSFTVGGNKINNTIKTEQIAYYRKSYKGNMDLNKESARFISKHNADKIERFSDQMAYSKDLIVNEDGGEVVCKIDNVGQNKIYYSTYENEQRKQGSISKFDVEYYVKNYAENPEDKVVLLDFEKDRGELIITSEGQYYPGEIINVGYNSIEFKEAGSADKRYFNMADVLYYGKSFLNTIREGNKLQHPTYTDLIYKSNNSVLLCQIDKVTLGNVRYSFILGGRTLYNDVPKDDIVYYGVNIFNDEDGAGVLAQKTEPTTTKEEEIGKTKDQANTDPEDQANTDQEAKVEKVKKEVASEPVAMKQEEKVVEEKVVEEPRDDTPPELILFTPQITSAGNLKSVENETSKVRVSGIILDDGGLSELMINGDKVSTTKEGKFDLEVSLAVGDNSISILASDKSSNALSESFSIVREQQVAQAPVQKKAADSEPPVLSISYPRPETPGEPIIVSNATKRVQIAGNVNDESGVFEVLVNNRDATLTATGDFRINIPLRVGENTLTIKASDLYFNDTETSMIIQRQDATVSYDTPEMIEDGAKYYALLIGVSDYQDPYIPSLDENPINDAKRLSEVLKEKYYFEEENMFYMPDPNRSDILRTFDRLSRSITDKDNLLIFFAGHGYYDEQTELGYWLPADAESEFTANWIYNDVLVANLKRINSRHTLLISDACFSGSIFKTRAMPGTAGVAYMKKYELSSRKAITSGVLESVPNESIFFKYFIEYLENNQEAMFSASELFRNIEIPIGNNSPNSPLYGVIQNVGDEGGDFLFIRR